VPMALAGALHRARAVNGSLGDRLKAAIAQLAGGGISRTQTYLVTGSDDDEGEIVLDGDGVRVNWNGIGDRPVLRSNNTLVQDLADGIQATPLRDPLWTRPFHHSLITVHPIGGCVMADNCSKGVVNDRGQVFSGETNNGTSVHPGLYVADGSIIPRPLAVNPSLTISALAERISYYIAG
jgi:cholesterol oxidase